jgi:hypothetical protein
MILRDFCQVHYFMFGWHIIKKKKQAGAELCQAQDKLGLASPSLPINEIEVVLQLKTMSLSSIDVIFHLPIH